MVSAKDLEQEVFRYSLYQLANSINEDVINVTIDVNLVKIHWVDGYISIFDTRHLNKLGIARKVLGLL